VYSFAGGIMHFYYLATLAPPQAALGGIGVVSLWDRYNQKGLGAMLLPLALLLTAAWQLHIEAGALGWKLDEAVNPIAALIALREGAGTWLTWLHIALVAGTLVAAGGLLLMLLRRGWGRLGQALAVSALGMGLLSLLAVPIAWTLSSVLVAGHGILPSADLARLIQVAGKAGSFFRGGLPENMGASKLVGFLKANRGGERYLLATSGTRLAAPIIIGTGEAVMAMGGFHGLDPIMTPEKLALMVEANQVRFVMLGDLSVISRILGGEVAGRPIAEWVRANGKLVDPALWRSTNSAISRLTLYDLRPGTPLIPAAAHER